ncbi:MAG: hypothetical protein WA981_15890 [Glaciecola sp.]
MMSPSFLYTVAFGALVYSLTANAVQVNEGSIEPYDCTNVALDDIDKSLLTREERIALLDNSLQESIDSYSTCVASATQNNAGGGNNGGGTRGDADGATSIGEGAANNNGVSENETPEAAPAPKIETPTNNRPPTQREVVPPKDNDKIICKLLFQEIESTTDPDMLKGLTEQYANYKCAT